MSFGISTNKALTVSASAMIECLLNSELSQIQAATTIAEGQGKLASLQAQSTIQSGENQAQATRDDSYAMLAQGVCALGGAFSSVKDFHDISGFNTAKEGELSEISKGRSIIDPKETKSALESASAAPKPTVAATDAEINKSASKIANAKTAEELEAATKGFKDKTLTDAQAEKLRTAYAAKEDSIRKNYDAKIGQTQARSQATQQSTQALGALTQIPAQQFKAKEEAEKAQNDAAAQITGAASNQDQSANAQILESRQQTAQEIGKILDAVNQANQAMQVRA